MSGMVWSYGATVTKLAVAFSPVAVIAMQDGVENQFYNIYVYSVHSSLEVPSRTTKSSLKIYQTYYQ